MPKDIGHFTGKLRAEGIATRKVSAAAYACLGRDIGCLLLLSPTATQTITLPPLGPVGRQLWLALLTDQTLIVQPGSADTLASKGDLDASNVTFVTGSEKIGAVLWLFSTGDVWMAVNLSDCTMGVTA